MRPSTFCTAMPTNGLFELLKSGEWDFAPNTVRALLEEGSIMTPAEGHRAMALALDTRQSAVIAEMLDHHVGVDFIDEHGRNAAHRLVSDLARNELDAWAGMQHATPPASLFGKLKAAGVDLDLADREGVTPLGLAAMAGPRSMGAFRHLVDAGANVNAPSTISSSPDGVLQLLSLPATRWAEGLGSPLQHGVAPLMFVLSVDDAQRLLSHGANPDSVDDLGNTPLMTPRYASLTADLIVLGADPNRRNAAGQTALMRQSDPEAVRTLLAAHADPNAEDLDGQTVLHAHLASSENLRNLFALGAIAKPGLITEAHRRYAGRTPPHDVFAQLFSHGANPNELVTDQVSQQPRPAWLVALRSHRSQALSILNSLAARQDFHPTAESVARAEDFLNETTDPRWGSARALLARFKS